jgi:hypothetical protein
MKENGEIVKCPMCDSSNIEPVNPFDYVKQCNNDECIYYLQHPKKYRYQFSTGIHN